MDNQLVVLSLLRLDAPSQCPLLQSLAHRIDVLIRAHEIPFIKRSTQLRDGVLGGVEDVEAVRLVEEDVGIEGDAVRGGRARECEGA